MTAATTASGSGASPLGEDLRGDIEELWEELKLGGSVVTRRIALGNPEDQRWARAWSSLRTFFEEDQRKIGDRQAREDREALFVRMLTLRDAYVSTVWGYPVLGAEPAATPGATDPVGGAGTAVATETTETTETPAAPAAEEPVPEGDGDEEVSGDQGGGQDDDTPPAPQVVSTPVAAQDLSSLPATALVDPADGVSGAGDGAEVAGETGAGADQTPPIQPQRVFQTRLVPGPEVCRQVGESPEQARAVRTVRGVNRVLSDLLQEEVETRLAARGIHYRQPVGLGTLLNLVMVMVLDLQGAEEIVLGEDDLAVLEALGMRRDTAWREQVLDRFDRLEHMIGSVAEDVGYTHDHAVENHSRSYVHTRLLSAIFAERLGLSDIPAGVRLDQLNVSTPALRDFQAEVETQATREYHREVDRDGRNYIR